MKEDIYSYTDSISNSRSYLIIEKIDAKEFITISGNFLNDKGEKIFYKTDKMLATFNEGKVKFSSGKFSFSTSELNISQVLGMDKIREAELNIPLKFQFKINYIGEFEKTKVKVISISDFDDSKSDSIIIYSLEN
jgi:hypothetical protein